MKFMNLAIVAALMAIVSAQAETAPAPKKGGGEGKGQGWGQWKKNPENIKAFDANGDGQLSGEEETSAKAAWKKASGRDGGCDGENKEGGCGENKGGCGKDKKAGGCSDCESGK